MVFTENTFVNCLTKLNEINAILFFQSNFGLAIEMSNKIKEKFNHDEIVVLDFQNIEKTFIQQLQENLCDGFFSTKKIIMVYNFKPNGKSKIKDEIKFLDEKKINDKIVLFFAPELDGKSAFKTFFEKGNFTASISCYEDDEKIALDYIKNFFKNENIKISDAAVKIMAEMLHGDRQLLKSECEKMILYCDNNEVTIADVNNCIINEQNANLTFFIDNILSGNIKQAVKELELLEKEDYQMIIICRGFIKSIEDIIDIQKNINDGLSVDFVIKNKFFFWKRIPYIKKAVLNCKTKTLENFIKIAIEAEKISKIYGNNISKQYFVRNIILYQLRLQY